MVADSGRGCDSYGRQSGWIEVVVEISDTKVR